MAQTSPPTAPAARGLSSSIPGLTLIWECLHITPGSWLVERPTIDWLGDQVLVSQLPRSLRIFARYCSAQRGHPAGAELLLRLIIWLRRRLRAEYAVRLNVRGTPIYLDVGDPRFLAVPPELNAGLPRILKTFLHPGDTFIDVGSNHGTFAVTGAQLVGPKGLIVAIEPQARLAALARRSLELYDAPFVVHNVACSDRTGSATFYRPRATSGSAGLHPAHSAVSLHQTETVPLSRLDDLLDPDQLPGRVFMKIDVEGSEVHCLAGAREVLARANPAILIEINPGALAAAGSSKEALIAALRESGYDRYLAIHDDPDRKFELTPHIAERDIIALHASWR